MSVGEGWGEVYTMCVLVGLGVKVDQFDHLYYYFIFFFFLALKTSNP